MCLAVTTVIAMMFVMATAHDKVDIMATTSLDTKQKTCAFVCFIAAIRHDVMLTDRLLVRCWPEAETQHLLPQLLLPQLQVSAKGIHIESFNRNLTILLLHRAGRTTSSTATP